MKLDIAHGGWVPKGRRAEDGPIPSRYHLEEMTTESYPKRTEKNIREADGTLILTHGPATGGSRLTVDFAARFQRTHLHVDLLRTPAFQAIRVISEWITENDIEVLNVAGSSASKDPAIYDKTLQILTGVYWLDQLHVSHASPAHHRTPANPPDTVDKAVKTMIASLPLKDKAILANLTEDELPGLDASLGFYVRNHFAPGPQNRQLFESCMQKAGDSRLSERDAAAVIIRELWHKVKITHKLRVVK
jgi:hypothetical protein